MKNGILPPVFGALFVLVALVGCDDDADPFVPPSFDRADQVALACLDVVRNEGVPVADCESGDEAADTHLIALVTQSQRGELAIVDLDDQILLDVDPQVPGYTFHPVGELPTGVTVSPDGTRAYVACSGSRNLAVFDIGTIAGPQGRLDPIDLEGHAPFDVVASDDRLFVTVPDEGMLLAIDVESGAVTTELALAGGAGPGGGADAGVDDAGTTDAGAIDGGADGGGAAVGEASRPWRMALDLEERRLYAANAGRSVISVVDVDAVTEVEQLAIGVPTTTLAVSPVRREGDGGRWLYAVEHSEGGVRVWDLAAGALVDANRIFDGETVVYDDPWVTSPAIQVPGSARAVEIFTRGSDLEAAPKVLDGLFAAIASSDGFLYIVDIEDDDAEQRASVGEEIGYQDLPHHLRSFNLLTSTELPQVASNPVVQVGSAQVICGSDYGFIAHFGPDAPPCDDAGQGLQVLQDYPWAATNETWTVTFEGTIPGTARPRGNLEGDDQVVDAAADFCALGVQPGDRFTLDTIPEAARDGVDCGDPGDFTRGWEIAEVFEQHLVLAETFGVDPADCGLDEWVDYRIRTENVWTVVGSRSGFLHHVIAEGTGDDRRCGIDPDADERLVGRAPESAPEDAPPAGECTFQNPTLCFTMVQGVGEIGTVRTAVDTSWTFSTVNALEPLVIRAGSLPVSLRYLPVRDLMVVVDPVVEGLIEVSMTSLVGERSYR